MKSSLRPGPTVPNEHGGDVDRDAMPAEEVYIALGSNLGDSKTIVKQAMKAIDHIRDCDVIAHSSLYRSAAIGEIVQDDYINAVVLVSTKLEPVALLLELQAIEYAYYRRRDEEQRWGPRTLDLDIILFGNRRFEDSHLVIPHPEFVNRRFVLEPMLEIGGDRFIPGHGSLAYLVEQAPSMEMKRLRKRHG